MNKYIGLLALLFSVTLSAQTFEELTDTKPIDTKLWTQQKEGLTISWASTNTRYSKTNAPKLKVKQNQKLQGWKGEKINAAIAVWNTSSDCVVELTPSSLKSGNSVIPKENITIGIIRQVMTDEFIREGKTSCGFRKDKTEWDSSLVADIIDTENKSILRKHNTTSAWVTIQIPQDIPSGLYKGEVAIKKDGKLVKSLHLAINVGDLCLPNYKDWSFHLDLWQNPYAVARFHNVEVWSAEHMKLMEDVMKPLAKAGQKVITTSIMHKPWNGQTYDYFESMVTWIKRLDGSWEFKYDIFDKWISFMHSLGIDQQINCYSMVPWNFAFRYFDERTNDMAVLKAKPGEAAYNEMWSAFLIDFAKHLKSKGWFDKTCIAMDERPMDVMKTVISLVRKADPEYKLALAGQFFPEIEEHIYDYCVSLDQTIPQDVIDCRKANGFITTYYTYCADPKPNVFTFSDPAEAAWIPIFVAKLGFDGYLRWAYNSWGENPLQDSRFRQWPAGDTHYVYPGFRSSIRFEKTLEGIQQYEKIEYLKRMYANNKSMLKRIQKEVDAFTFEDVFKDGNASYVTERMQRFLNQF